MGSNNISVLKAVAVLSMGLSLAACGGSGGSAGGVSAPGNGDNGGGETTPNQPPVIAVEQANQTIEYGQQEVSLRVSASDDSSSSLSYQWSQTAGVAVELFDADTAIARFATPVVHFDQAAQSLTFRLTVSDDDGAQSSADLSVVIQPNNHLPVLTLFAPSAANAGEEIVLNADAQDSDGEIVAYQWQQISGPEIDLIAADTANARFVTPAVRLDSPVVFKLKVSDDKQATAEQQLSLNIVGVNVPPVIAELTPQTAPEQTATTLSVSASDDLAITSYHWTQTQGAAVELSNADSKDVSFTTPTVLATEGEQLLTFQVVVTDSDNAATTGTLNLSVMPNNSLPSVQVSSVAALESGYSSELSVTAHDSDGTINQYQWRQTGGPAAQLAQTDSATAMMIAPMVAAKTTLTFAVDVTDNELGMSTASTEVVVLPANTAPQVAALDNQTVDEQSAVHLSVSATDDYGIAAYQWRQTAGTNVSLTGADSANASFKAPVVLQSEGAQTLSFEITVTDSHGITACQSTDVTVNPVNVLPTVTVDNSGSAIAGTTIELTSSSQDSDGTITSYQWTQTNGSAVTLIGANQANASFIVPEVGADEQASFKLTVTDNEGATQSASTSLSMLRKNSPPIALAGNDQTVDEQVLVTLTAAAIDDLGIDNLTYQWQQLSGPSVTLSTTEQLSTQFTAPSVLISEQAQTLIFALTVTDSDGAVATDQVQVVVNPVNTDPVVDALTRQFSVAGDTVQIAAVATDSDGSIAQYQWLQTGGTNVELSNAAGAEVRFTAPAGIKEKLSFSVIATDNEGATASQSVDVFVSNDSDNQNFVDTQEQVDALSGGATTIHWDLVSPEVSGFSSVVAASAKLEQITGSETLKVTMVENRQAIIEVPAVISGSETYQFELTLASEDGKEAKTTIEIVIKALQSQFAARETLQQADKDYAYRSSFALDVDRDGFTDLLGVSSGGDLWQWHKNLAGAELERTPRPFLVDDEQFKGYFYLLDIDRDGLQDLVYRTKSSLVLEFALNTQQGFITAGQIGTADDKLFSFKSVINPINDELTLYFSQTFSSKDYRLTSFSYVNGAFVRRDEFEGGHLQFVVNSLNSCDLNHDGVNELYTPRYNPYGYFSPNDRKTEILVSFADDNFQSVTSIFDTKADGISALCYDNRLIVTQWTKVDDIERKIEHFEVTYNSQSAGFEIAALPQALSFLTSSVTLLDANDDGMTDIITSSYGNFVESIWLAKSPQSLQFTKHRFSEQKCRFSWYEEAKQQRLICSNSGLVVSKVDATEADKALSLSTVGGRKIVSVSVKGNKLLIKHVDESNQQNLELKQMSQGQLEVWTEFSLSNVLGTPYMLDTNKDGIDDFVYVVEDEVTETYDVRLSLGSGPGFLPAQSLLTFTADDLIPYPGAPFLRTPYLMNVSDIDKDGRPELGIALLGNNYEGYYKLYGFDAATQQYTTLPAFGYSMVEAYTDRHFYGDVTNDQFKDVIWFNRSFGGCQGSYYGCGYLNYRKVDSMSETSEWTVFLDADNYGLRALNFWDVNQDGRQSLFINLQTTPLSTYLFNFDDNGGFREQHLDKHLEFAATLVSGGPKYYIDTRQDRKLMVYRYEPALAQFVTHMQLPMHRIMEASNEQERFMFDIDGDGDDDLITWDQGGVFWYQNMGPQQ